jgi:hypothetical protein
MVDEYLRQLRASLRTRPAETNRILAEAEDHLRESVAAGLSAGLTRVEAEEAAISAFGSVRTVVRAHQTGRSRAAEVLAECCLAWSKLAGLFLLAFSVVGVAGLAFVEVGGASTIPVASSALEHLAAGAAGLLLLAGYHLARRRRRRGTRVVTRSATRYFPLVAVIVFGGGAVAQVLLKVSGTVPGVGPALLTSLVLAAGYTARIGWMLRPRGKTA